jgi:glycosyltransferase involved in cell wall biosynthesis
VEGFRIVELADVWEVVVVDDESTDVTPWIVNEFAAW